MRVPTATSAIFRLIKKMRLDLFLFETGLSESRTEAKNFITSGKVSVNGKTVTKPAFDISGNESVIVDREAKKYVCRGGLKLEGALSEFNIDVKGRLALDVGASSGGFTDCLLKHGASRVMAIDSGTGQLVKALREDNRVISKEGFNARYMKREDLAFIPEIAVMDVSFISATYIIGAIYECLAEDGDFICLIKPQFEAGRGAIGKGGIVKSEKDRRQAVEKVTLFAESCGFKTKKVIESPIKGGDGNIEYLAHFRKEAGGLEGNNNSQSDEG